MENFRKAIRNFYGMDMMFLLEHINIIQGIGGIFFFIYWLRCQENWDSKELTYWNISLRHRSYITQSFLWFQERCGLQPQQTEAASGRKKTPLCLPERFGLWPQRTVLSSGRKSPSVTSIMWLGNMWRLPIIGRFWWKKYDVKIVKKKLRHYKVPQASIIHM